jgi:dCMP deaminase
MPETERNDEVQKPHVRPSWDDYFMALARIIATRSSCDRLHAGAVLVKDGRIISTGYNGAPPGLDHCDDVGHLMEEGHCVRTVHGEHNALLQAAVLGGSSTKGSTMYSVYTPCIHCAKYIATCGIVRVVYGKIYRNSSVIEYFQQAGIVVEEYRASEAWNEHAAALFAQEIMQKDDAVVELRVEKTIDADASV